MRNNALCVVRCAIQPEAGQLFKTVSAPSSAPVDPSVSGAKTGSMRDKHLSGCPDARCVIAQLAVPLREARSLHVGAASLARDRVTWLTRLSMQWRTSLAGPRSANPPPEARRMVDGRAMRRRPQSRRKARWTVRN